MNITKATIVLDPHNADTVILTTNLPNPCYPYNGNLTVDFRVASHQAADYVLAHFPGIEIETVGKSER